MNIDLTVAAVCLLCLAGGIWAWWIDSGRNRKSSDEDQEEENGQNGRGRQADRKKRNKR